jgi:hypothetical protein
MSHHELACDILIVGGGTGGCAAALAACRAGRRVIMTEPCEWVGGQLTSQAVPPDENRWIESHGGTLSYQRFREGIRRYYRDHYPLSASARTRPQLNPGGGFVSRLCHEPKVAHAVLRQMLAGHESRGLLRVLRFVEPTAADVDGDVVRSVTFGPAGPTLGGGRGDVEPFSVTADYVLDATELGDLLPMTGCELVVGAESQADTGELNARPGPADPGNVQSITWCFAIAHDPTPGAHHVIDKPVGYERWRDDVPPLTPAWPGKLFSWTDAYPYTLEPRHNFLFREEYDPQRHGGGQSYWAYRQIVDGRLWDSGHRPHDATLVNWPMNDYMAADLMDPDPAKRRQAMTESRELSRSLLYWLQTEAPNGLTGGTGYPALYPLGTATGTNDGLAQYPYVRESRRIRGRFTVTEQHVGTLMRTGKNRLPGEFPSDLEGLTGERFDDSVGIGHYRIDLHMSTAGDNYIDASTLPFQIPLGALIPVRLRNLLPACKNIAPTHVTNGCYRLHPVEWNIGEAAGALAAWCLEHDLRPHQVHEHADQLADFQKVLVEQGVRLEWERTAPV